MHWLTQLEIIIKDQLSETMCISDDQLYDSIRELSDLFTKKRIDLNSTYFSNPKYRAAYLAGFTLQNSAKVYATLRHLHELETVQWQSPICMLDYGIGTGAASLAASQFFRYKMIRMPCILQGWIVKQRCFRISIHYGSVLHQMIMCFH